MGNKFIYKSEELNKLGIKEEYKMKYSVRQGKLTYSGCGDVEEWKRFSNLKDAKKYFNKIKKDIEGWHLHSNEYLYTEIVDVEKETRFEPGEIIDAYEYELRK